MQRLLKNLKAHCPFIQSLLFLVYCPLFLTLVEGAVGDWSALYLFEDKGIVIEEGCHGCNAL